MGSMALDECYDKQRQLYILESDKLKKEQLVQEHQKKMEKAKKVEKLMEKLQRESLNKQKLKLENEEKTKIEKEDPFLRIGSVMCRDWCQMMRVNWARMNPMDNAQRMRAARLHLQFVWDF